MTAAEASNKISLLVPCYNAENYIDNFILHLNKASLQFDEVLFYNDGSTDNTLELLKRSGYKFISSDSNNGPGHARNQLINVAAFEYIHFHDIDDPIEPDYLSEIKKSLSTNYDAIFCDADWIDAETGKVVIQWKYRNELFKKEGLAYLIRNPVGGINGLYKKEALLELGGFDENLKVWEDADLNFRFALFKKSIFFTETVLVTSLRYVRSTSNNDHKIRKYKYLFLSKYAYVDEHVFRQELIKQANSLFHEAVYEKDWALYSDIKKLAKTLNVKIPITPNVFLDVLKTALGPKFYTQIKYYFLKKFVLNKPAEF